VALAEKRYADAAKDLELVKQQQPGNFLVYDRLAVAYQGGGDLAAAERVLREARERIPYRRAAYTDNLAVVLVLTQRPGEALTELEAVRETARREIGSAAAVFYRAPVRALAELEARAVSGIPRGSHPYHDDETKSDSKTPRIASLRCLRLRDKISRRLSTSSGGNRKAIRRVRSSAGEWASSRAQQTNLDRTSRSRCCSRSSGIPDGVMRFQR
jgi:tetratricopeptide (TPR) repeat protein